jgi:hypothetical protein
LESNSPSVCRSKTTNRDGILILLKASNKPGRVALVCRVISLRPVTAFVATHLGTKLVKRHGAEHREPLAEHLERNPDRSLAALASDPGITLGLELRDSSVVGHPCIKARSSRVGKSSRCWAWSGSEPLPIAQRRSLLSCSTDG